MAAACASKPAFHEILPATLGWMHNFVALKISNQPLLLVLR